ncbi:hypothetical protein [Citrobacter farmeri]|uniref:hypothetical protein n=1 Tax=Citrobacter farmeri TaxID=67824 RepID=UPI000F6899CB|nr:hypothetical protein [Citrobacter farmeri]RSB19780.1 hypothetical protein EGK65_08845 [Citrobacter farmeri]
MKTERISNLSLTTITRFTKEQLLKRLEGQMSSGRYALGFVQDSEILRDIEMDLSIAEIALASLEAEAVAWTEKCEITNMQATGLYLRGFPDNSQGRDIALYAAPLHGKADTELQRKAAIHDALCEKYNVESLADFIDWQRNHIAELEAAPPARVVPGEASVMPDYPGYVMTQRECFQAGKKAGMAETGNSPVILDGWVMVPVEPTTGMLRAGFLAGEDYPGGVYRAMLAAAPQQEVEPVPKK